MRRVSRNSGLGAVVDGANPQVVLNEDVLEAVNPGDEYLRDEEQRQLLEIQRRRALYGLSGSPAAFGRTYRYRSR